MYDVSSANLKQLLFPGHARLNQKLKIVNAFTEMKSFNQMSCWMWSTNQAVTWLRMRIIVPNLNIRTNPMLALSRSSHKSKKWIIWNVNGSCKNGKWSYETGVLAYPYDSQYSIETKNCGAKSEKQAQKFQGQKRYHVKWTPGTKILKTISWEPHKTMQRNTLTRSTIIGRSTWKWPSSLKATRIWRFSFLVLINCTHLHKNHD